MTRAVVGDSCRALLSDPVDAGIPSTSGLAADGVAWVIRVWAIGDLALVLQAGEACAGGLMRQPGDDFSFIAGSAAVISDGTLCDGADHELLLSGDFIRVEGIAGHA